MLSQHPQVAFAGPFDFLADGISPKGRFMKRDAYLRGLRLNRTFTRSGLSIAPNLNFAGLANDFLDQVAAPKNASIVGVTMHRDFDRVLRLWPDARFIHLVRDGRDVALSRIPACESGNMWRGIAQWVEVEALWTRITNKLPVERQITVKFDDLVKDAEHELHRICQLLAIDYRPEMLRHGAPVAYLSALQAGIGKWRDHVPADLSAAEHAGARFLLQNGYFLGGSVRPPSIFRRIYLIAQDRFVLSMHRRRIVGTKFWLKSLWTRRLGSKKARAKLTLRENELLNRAEERAGPGRV